MGIRGIGKQMITITTRNRKILPFSFKYKYQALDYLNQVNKPFNKPWYRSKK